MRGGQAARLAQPSHCSGRALRDGGCLCLCLPWYRSHVCLQEEPMADPRAFVSFDFDHDERSKNLFVGQARSDSPTPFMVHDWSSKTALPQAEWERLIKAKMASTNMCIVLVGRSMATATGVAKEIAMANALNVPVFG